MYTFYVNVTSKYVYMTLGLVIVFLVLMHILFFHPLFHIMRSTFYCVSNHQDLVTFSGCPKFR